jgi:spore maturation protein CgeB
LAEAAALVPGACVHAYRDSDIDLDRATDGAALVVAQEWNSPDLIGALGRHRAGGGRYVLLFHDSHHRSITAPAELDAFDLDGYDGVLAFGEVIRQVYLKRGWARRVFTFHEAADTVLFRPLAEERKHTDLIWIGNWGDDERSRELTSYLINPAVSLALRTRVHGVRYPQAICDALAGVGIDHAGWLPNHRAPWAYARAGVTVHVPRRPYCEALPGIPTIRVFEALACGIPLVSAPWRDEEELFPQGAYLSAANESEMCAALSLVLHDRDAARGLIDTGLRAINDRHSCAHRVRQLLSIVDELRGSGKPHGRYAAQSEWRGVMS